MPLRDRLERYFDFAALGATWRTEVLAGCTTFMTMAYIIFVNPAILHETGMPLAAVTAATCVSAAIGSFLMGGYAKYPIALAPGMGLNAYFTYAVVKGMGVPWQTALGAVFISGVVFILLTLVGIRQLIVVGDSARIVRRGGGGCRALHRADRISQRRHYRAQPRHYGHAGKPARPQHRAVDFRTAADSRAARLEGARGDADRHPRHFRRWRSPPVCRTGSRTPRGCPTSRLRRCGSTSLRRCGSGLSRLSSSFSSSTSSTTSGHWSRWERRRSCSTRLTRSRG